MANFRERLTTNANDFDGIVTDMLTEMDALRQDALRYRWLRDHYHGFEQYRSGAVPYVTLDSEVDKQLAAKKE